MKRLLPLLMKYLISVLVSVGVLVQLNTAQSRGTGNGFYELCKADTLVCTGYIDGWIDSWHLHRSFIFEKYRKTTPNLKFEDVKTLPVCLPENHTISQLGEIFYKYLANHPELRHLQTGVLAYKAMRKAFPCK